MRDDIRRAIEGCYSAVGDAEAWREAIQRLCTALAVRGAVFIPLDVKKIDFPLVPSEAIEESSAAYIRDRWTDHDFRIPRMLPQLHRGVLLEEDVSTDEEMRTTPYFQEFLAPFHLKWWAGVFCEGGGEKWCLSLLRTDREERFGEAERLELGLLKPHLGRMLDTAKVLEALRVDASVESLGKGGVAAALLNRQGRIVASTLQFRGLIGAALTVRADRIHARQDAVEREFQERLRRVLSHLVSGVSDDVMIVPPYGENGALAVRILPLAARPLPIIDTARAMVVLTDLASRRTDVSSHLTRGFGLSAHEARIATLIGAGQSPADVAGDLGLTIGTVRAALHKIYVKLDVTGQAGVVRIVARLTQNTPR